MNLDRRLGNQDVDAATLFAAARSFRPSARGRRRALRALGLPVGLSLFGSGLAHAAYLISSSLKGWGMVAGVVATVGAAGGVTYVVTAPPTPSVTRRAVSKSSSAPGTRPPRAPLAAAPVPARTTEPPPNVAALPFPLPRVEPLLPRPVSVHRLARRAEPPVLSPVSSPAISPVSSPALSPTLPSGLSAESGAVPSPAGAPPPVSAASPSDVTAPPPFRVLPVTSAATTTRSSRSSAPSPLNGELALVAEAQARLRSGDAPGAFAALDRYLRLYPEGAMAEEAELLRVRAFIANGDSHAARKTGETFLHRHPGSPLVARFRSLLNALDVPTIR